ncbi:MAG: hypothetical protein R2788_07710 [Saprospiraceae bacterium]
MNFFLRKQLSKNWKATCTGPLLKNGLPKDQFAVYGHVLGGCRAMKFGILVPAGKIGLRFFPKAIAVCDAPLDMVRFWKQLTRSKKLKLNEIAANEAEWVTAVLERNLGKPSHPTISAPITIIHLIVMKSKMVDRLLF